MTPFDPHRQSPAARGRSPLCDSEFNKPSSDLRPVVPPRWMNRGILGSIAGAIFTGAFVLLSPMDEFVSAPGVVRPADFKVVFSRAEGILESIPARDGIQVERGDILAEMELWPLRREVARLEGELAQAKREVELAEAALKRTGAAPVPAEFLFSGLEVERQSELQSLHRDYLDRLKQLESTGAASGVELINVRLQLISSEALLKRSQLANELFKGGYGEAAIAEATARKNLAEARVLALQQELEVTREGIGRLVILAPVSGTIISTARRHAGEKVEAGEALFRISSSDRIQLRLYATEDRIDKVHPGQLVRFRANNNPDRLALPATGTVLEAAEDRDLEAEKKSSGSHNSYRIHVQVDKAPYELAIGATVEAEIVIGRRPLWRLIMQRSADRM